MTSSFVKTGIDLGHVVLFRTVSNREETESFGVESRVCTEDVENDLRSRSVVSGSNNVSVTDNHQEFALVVVLKFRERVDTVAE